MTKFQGLENDFVRHFLVVLFQSPPFTIARFRALDYALFKCTIDIDT